MAYRRYGWGVHSRGYESVTVSLLRVGDIVQTAEGRDVQVAHGPVGRYVASLARKRRTGARVLRVLEFGDVLELKENHTVLRRVRPKKDDPSLPPPPPVPQIE